ncbi:hypothetical protein M3936_19885 [Sutcliffiella horikoshii]|uniref:hypothetical protein n=1 Tax=Sutcliffiella horikoshii TaxID=79883 RepID=UPI00203FF497|nr:hypothetical protein [Sutcliffiella horikoshii]MCM3619835.1 hypothetical protein [Sutcliffiella horikoshii]
MTKQEGPPSTPRWVNVFGIIVIVLVLLFVIMKVTGIGGEHGPSHHFSLIGVGNDVSLIKQGIIES